VGIAWGKVWAEWWMGKTFPAVYKAAVESILGCTGHSPSLLLGHGATLTENHYCTTAQHLKKAIVMKHPDLHRESDPSP
jgi:hypothetical protein